MCSVCARAERGGSERTSPWERGAAPSFINQRPQRHTPRLSHLTASDGDAAMGGVPCLFMPPPERGRPRACASEGGLRLNGGGLGDDPSRTSITRLLGRITIQQITFC